MPNQSQDFRVEVPPTPPDSHQWLVPSIEDAPSNRRSPLSQAPHPQPYSSSHPVDPGPASRPRSTSRPASRRSSITQTSFAATTKNAIRRFGSLCWICGRNDPLEVAHVIEAHERFFFHDWKQQGLVNIGELSYTANGIMLCTTCHPYFDAPRHHWLLLPCDLPFFISREESDFSRRRLHLQETGVILPRIAPTAEDYKLNQVALGQANASSIGGLYSCWVVKQFMAGDGRTLDIGNGGQREWHGDPMAAIMKSSMVPTILLPEAPSDFQDLVRLYLDNDRQLLRIKATRREKASGTHRDPPRDHGNNDDGDGSSKQSSPHSTPTQKGGKSLPSRRSVRVQTLQQSGQQQRHMQQPLMELVTSRKPRSRPQSLDYKQLSDNKRIKLPPSPEYFEFGPERTVQHLIDMATFFSRPAKIAGV